METIVPSDDGVEVVFKDGTRVKGSVVIGCDGSNSSTRQWLFDYSDEGKWNPLPGLILNNFWMKFTREQAIKCKASLGAFLDIAIHPNGSYYGLIRKTLVTRIDITN